MNWMPQLQILGQVALAGLLGGIIGAEREWSGKPAGLRTQMFVAAAAALLVSLGPVIVQQIDVQGAARVRTDPIRIVEAVVTGISFIGAGSIIFVRGEHRLEGVTTAATVLLTMAVGIAVALKQYVLAVSVTVLVVVVLWLMGKIDAVIHGRRSGKGEG